MKPEATPMPERHVFARIINSPPLTDYPAGQQFLLRLCHEPYLANLPHDTELLPGEPFRAVTIDTEVPQLGAPPKARRAVLGVPYLPTELFGAPLLAAFVWQDCATFNQIWDWVDARTVDPIATRAAQEELTANLLARLRAAWPEYFVPKQN